MTDLRLVNAPERDRSADSSDDFVVAVYAPGPARP